jgi:hypothetical protein
MMIKLLLTPPHTEDHINSMNHTFRELSLFKIEMQCGNELRVWYFLRTSTRRLDRLRNSGYPESQPLLLKIRVAEAALTWMQP